ncbi:MAG TPA: MFS transporter [Anaeromyxobacter sp.]
MSDPTRLESRDAPPADRRSPAGQGAPARKWSVLLAVGIGTFMSALDGSIVNAVLPAVREALGTTVAGIEWVVSIYLLVVSGVLLGFGRLGDLRGHRGVYLAGLGGFVVTSALCGLAPSAPWLVAARALQALAAAMLFANSPAILTLAFPPSERGRALGLQSTMTYLGLSAGPPLGGLLAAHLGWRAIFFVNVPIGLVGLALGRAVVPHDEPHGDVPRFDLLGAGAFFVGLFGLLLALDQGHDWGWRSPVTLGLAGASLAVLATFVAIERRRPHPMLDLSLFQARAFTGSAFSAVASYVGEYAVLFLVPFYLVQARGLPVQHAGAMLSALPLMMLVAAPVAGELSDRLGPRRFTVAGMAVLTAGLLLLSRNGPGTPTWRIAGALAVAGLGLGLFIAPNNSRLLGAAPPHRRGIASGVLAAARNVGMVLGVGLAGAVYTTVLARTGQRGVAEGVSAGLVAAAGVTALATVTSWLEAG